MLTKLSILVVALCWMADSPGSGTPAGPCAFYYSKELKKNVYTSVEIEPEFPGGAASYQRFLNRNLRYPQEQIDSEDWQSSAIMKFIVDTNGQIKNISVNDKDSIQMTPFEREVFRIIKLMPNWTPGYCKGKAVTTAHKHPLMVCLSQEE